MNGFFHTFREAKGDCVQRSCCHRLDLLVVIPGKLARPGIQENQKLLDTRLHGYDGVAPADLFCVLQFRDTSTYYITVPDWHLASWPFHQMSSG
jgi:hypothetical protein